MPLLLRGGLWQSSAAAQRHCCTSCLCWSCLHPRNHASMLDTETGYWCSGPVPEHLPFMRCLLFLAVGGGKPCSMGPEQLAGKPGEAVRLSIESWCTGSKMRFTYLLMGFWPRVGRGPGVGQLLDHKEVWSVVRGRFGLRQSTPLILWAGFGKQYSLGKGHEGYVCSHWGRTGERWVTSAKPRIRAACDQCRVPAWCETGADVSTPGGCCAPAQPPRPILAQSAGRRPAQWTAPGHPPCTDPPPAR